MRNEPRSKMYLSCAEDTLLRYHSRNARAKLIRSGVKLKGDSSAVNLWETREGGTFRAVTVASGNLGFGWDLGVIDDPFKSFESAQSPLVQAAVWEWWQNDWKMRAQASASGRNPCQILMHQRLAIGDLWGRIEVWLENYGLEEWTVLCLPGYAPIKAFSFPEKCQVLPDPRSPGEPLCQEDSVMVQIDDRARTNPRLYDAVDSQRPEKNAGGGVFCEAWNQIIGVGLADLPTYDAVLKLVKDGIISAPTRRGRGWDFNAGGSDKTASALGGAVGDRWLWESAVEYSPPAAALAQLVIDTATGDGKGVEQVLPNEPAVGKAFSERLKGDLERLGITVHLASQREPKRSRSLQHAQKAAAKCRRCGKLMVPSESVNMFTTQGVCACPDPDGDGFGGVLFLSGAWNKMAADRLHLFTGEPGGQDDLADAMAVLFNAFKVSGGEWFVGATGGTAAKEPEPTRLHNFIEDM
jgi:hypothetical protein